MVITDVNIYLSVSVSSVDEFFPRLPEESFIKKPT